LGQAVYLAAIKGEPLKILDTTKWRIAKEFGWTLEYIESLDLKSIEEFHQYDAVVDGLRKAHAFLNRRK
jgi:hypothetical protein